MKRVYCPGSHGVICLAQPLFPYRYVHHRRFVRQLVAGCVVCVCFRRRTEGLCRRAKAGVRVVLEGSWNREAHACMRSLVYSPMYCISRVRTDFSERHRGQSVDRQMGTKIVARVLTKTVFRRALREVEASSYVMKGDNKKGHKNVFRRHQDSNLGGQSPIDF
jgi:hypothetical protein